MLVYHHIWSHSHQSLPSNLHTGSFIPLKLPFFVSKMTFFLQSINKKFQPWYFLICRPPLIRLIIKFSCVQVILFLWSLKHSIEFNCFLSLESNTISFYSVTFHSTFQHFHGYTTGFCPWSSSLFVVHKPCQSNLYKGFDFISFIC